MKTLLITGLIFFIWMQIFVWLLEKDSKPDPDVLTVGKDNVIEMNGKRYTFEKVEAYILVEIKEK